MKSSRISWGFFVAGLCVGVPACDGGGDGAPGVGGSAATGPGAGASGAGASGAGASGAGATAGDGGGVGGVGGAAGGTAGASSGLGGASGSSSGGSAAGGSAAGGSAAGGSAGGQSGASGAAVGGAGASGGVAGSDGGVSGAGSAGAGQGGMPGSGCAGADYLICEDFESTPLGEVPSGWTRRGSEAAVADDEAHGGAHALKLGAVASGERRIARDAGLLGSAHYGRIFYRVQAPVPDAFVHSTFVSLMGDGPTNGTSEYRPIDTVKQAKDTPDVGSRHNFIYNVQIIGGSEFGRETSYDYLFDEAWHCAEYHIDASNQSFSLSFDGEEVLAFENGAGQYDRTDIPSSFDEVRVGFNNYQSAPPGFTVWIDDVAFDDQPIGCN